VIINYGMLSTHPPTRCGLAAFNSALADELITGAGMGGVVRVTTGGDDEHPKPGVVHTWSSAAPDGWRGSADALNSYDVAVIQHDYSIYPGTDGTDVLQLLNRLTVPSIVVLHTVLAQPSVGQKRVLEQVAAAAGAVVTMTTSGRDRLLLGYDVDAAKVWVIPHGVTVQASDPPPARNQRSHLLTWGLLSPGKGIEWMLRALARLRDLDPALRYTIAGQTHPRVAEQEGEAYRRRLQRLGALLGVAHAVTYRADYHDPAALSMLIASADIVVLPYDSTEQVSSGVLVEAVAAGVPVVATAFPHAVELLSDGVGVTVPHQDSAALAAAIRLMLKQPDADVRADISAPSTMRWPAVAERYQALAQRLIRTAPTAIDVT
jgi:glycosyltransferase involved in cell wall biosynthesis